MKNNYLNDKNRNGKTGWHQEDARTVALKTLLDVTKSQAYSQLALANRLKNSRLSDLDKKLATQIFYSALENRLQISWIIKRYLDDMPDHVVEAILHIAAAQILYLDKVPNYASVNEAVKQSRQFRREQFSGLINAVLRNMLRENEQQGIELPKIEDDPIEYLSIKYSYTKQLAMLLVNDYGFDEAERIMAYKQDSQLQTIRPNLLLFYDDKFEMLLANMELDYSKGSLPISWKVRNAGSLTITKEFKKGLFSIQGEGSMLAALAVKPKPGENVLDACSAPGGKAALLSELMKGSGRVHAWDIHENRTELIRINQRRLGLDNIKPAVRDASILREDLINSFDAVLIDAPCSGLGVVADKPEIKFNTDIDDIDSLKTVQSRILDICSKYVKPKGRLVYSTCTVTKAENEQMVDDFLEKHDGFEADVDRSFLPESYKTRFSRGMIQLLPHRDGTEGFFIACMRKKA